jgi:PAS domain S-box-containing protein
VDVASNIGVAVWVYDPHERLVVFANDAAEQLWGRPFAVGTGMEEFLAFVHPGDRRALGALFSRGGDRRHAQDVRAFECRLQHASGDWIWVRMRFRAVAGRRGRELFVGTSIAVTAEKEAESALARSRQELEERVRTRTAALAERNRQLRSEIRRRLEIDASLRTSRSHFEMLLNSCFDQFVELDEDGRLLRVSHSVCELMGRSKAELLGQDVRDLLTAHDSPRSEARLQECLRTGRARGEAIGVMDSSGRWRHFEWSSIAIREPQQRPRILACAREVTDRVAADRRFRNLFDGAPDAMVAVDLGGVVRLFNRQAERLFGWSAEQVLGEDVAILVPERNRAAHSRAMKAFIAGGRGGRIGSGRSLHGRRSDGSEVPVEITLSRDSPESECLVIAAVRDMTESLRQSAEREALELQVRHSQKLEGLGVLAGGIAHDFNNLLAGIVNYANLASVRLERGESATSAVSEIKDTALRMADLTNQMLVYAGRGRAVVEPVDLRTEVIRLWTLLSASISKKAVLREELAPELPLVLGDAGQLRQIVMNLITNGSEALGDAGGSITIRLGRLPTDRSELLAGLQLHGELPPDGVFLEVSDTGGGMDEATRDRMFDPFFTTKREGRGLGMSAVLGIVRGHAGAIGVASQPGAGTRCLVALPLSEQTELPSLAARTVSSRSLEGLRILLIDDEECVREPIRILLECWGARIECCADGVQGLAALRRGEVFDAVLLDLTLPALDGTEVLREIREYRPELAVILSSGYSVSDLGHAIDADPHLSFISKPYDIHELTDALLDLCGRNRHDGPPGGASGAREATAAASRVARPATPPRA